MGCFWVLALEVAQCVAASHLPADLDALYLVVDVRIGPVWTAALVAEMASQIQVVVADVEGAAVEEAAVLAAALVVVEVAEVAAPVMAVHVDVVVAVLAALSRTAAASVEALVIQCLTAVTGILETPAGAGLVMLAAVVALGRVVDVLAFAVGIDCLPAELLFAQLDGLLVLSLVPFLEAAAVAALVFVATLATVAAAAAVPCLIWVMSVTAAVVRGHDRSVQTAPEIVGCR